MTPGWPLLRLAPPVLTAALIASLAACTAGPPKPAPPPIQGSALPENVREVPGPAVAPGGGDAGGIGIAPAAAPVVAAPAPTLPAIVAQAIAAAPEVTLEREEPPSGREVAARVIASLSKVQSARLSARLPNGHRTDLVYVAPDRASLVERDASGQESARYVIIGDTGYTSVVSAGGSWRKSTDVGFRKQVEIFRPIQIALATGQPRALESGAEVEVVTVNGKQAMRAEYEYGASPELDALGLMRSTGNLLEVVVDPTTGLPLRTREVTQGALTEVDYLDWDQPATVEAPIS
jgi:hypothetical protein